MIAANKTIGVKNMPVMKSMCKTCPFREEHEGQVEIASMVRKRCITEASQVCHHKRLNGKKETHLCYGARMYQIQTFHRLGFIAEPTLEAWDAKFKQIKGR